MNKNELKSLHVIIHRALEEDLGDGDITTISTVPEKSVLKGTFIAKESGIIAGLEVVCETLKYLDPRIIFYAYVSNGKKVSKGTVLATVRGNGRALLTAEQTALNFFQRMSGIATTTHAYVNAVRKTKAIIVDTPKTPPFLRLWISGQCESAAGRIISWP